MSETRKGNKNRVDKTILKFRNIKTEEIFVGTKYDFCLEFSLNNKVVSKLITGERRTTYNWELVQHFFSTEESNLVCELD